MKDERRFDTASWMLVVQVDESLASASCFNSLEIGFTAITYITGTRNKRNLVGDLDLCIAN